MTVYKDDEVYKTISGRGNLTINIFTANYFGEAFEGLYNFKLSTTDATNTVAVINLRYSSYVVNIYTSGVTRATLQVTSYMPDIKVSDLFSGILKMFNLTAYSENENEYNIEPLEDWYNAGQIRDITKYVNLDGEVTRAPFYKVMNFQCEKSENLISRAFFDTFLS